MSAYTTVRMRDAEAALRLPEIRQIFIDSVAKIPEMDAVELMQWLLGNAHRPENLICLLRKGAEWKGYVICSYEPWVWNMDASLMMVWVAKGGGKAARKPLKRALADWMAERGAKRMVSVVRPDSTAAATIRLWNGDGLRLSKGRDTVHVELGG